MSAVEVDGITYVRWARPKQVGEVLDNGRPRPLPGTASGFDLSWYALDCWAKSRATEKPCEVVLIGYGSRSDGVYWYEEALNPDYLREVLGWSLKDGRLLPLCPECEGYPRHARGCSLAP